MPEFTFFLPELDYKLNMARILAVTDAMVDAKGTFVSLENILIFSFLAKHPSLIKRLVLISQEKKISIKDYEAYSISSKVLGLNDLYNSKEAKALVSNLIKMKMLDYKVHHKDGMQIRITESGKKMILELDSEYSSRVKEYASHLTFLRNKSANIIHAQINKALKEAQ